MNASPTFSRSNIVGIPIKHSKIINVITKCGWPSTLVGEFVGWMAAVREYTFVIISYLALRRRWSLVTLAAPLTSLDTPTPNISKWGNRKMFYQRTGISSQTNWPRDVQAAAVVCVFPSLPFQIRYLVCDDTSSSSRGTQHVKGVWQSKDTDLTPLYMLCHTLPAVLISQVSTGSAIILLLVLLGNWHPASHPQHDQRI